jgi:hypothetical protein
MHMEHTTKKMGRKDMEQLLNLLDQFFLQYDLHERNICHTNPVAKALKGHLEDQGRWKVAARGKNKRKRTFNQAVRENFKANKVEETEIYPPDLPRDHPLYCPF